jgi:hypothetical protein
MIESDHLKRATVDQLLNMSNVKKLVAKNKRKMFYANIASTTKCVYTNFYRGVWYFITYPWLKIKQWLKRLNISTNSMGCFNDENDKNVTSTPKKPNVIDTIPLAMMQSDSDDSDKENDFSEYYFFSFFNSFCFIRLRRGKI